MFTFYLPTGIEAEIREMTGAEEEILTNQKLIRSGAAINQVLKNCLFRLGDKKPPSMEDVLGLLSGDRLALLVRLREASLGNAVDLELVCANPACRETNAVTALISELEVTSYGSEREFTFTLPGSKQPVVFRYLDGHMEKRLAAMKTPSLSSAMTMRILSVDGQSPTKKSIREMTLGDRAALRREMQRVDAGVDTTVVVDCEACGTRLRTRLEGEPAFLFPGQVW